MADPEESLPEEVKWLTKKARLVYAMLAVLGLGGTGAIAFPWAGGKSTEEKLEDHEALPGHPLGMQRLEQEEKLSREFRREMRLLNDNLIVVLERAKIRGMKKRDKDKEEDEEGEEP